MWSRQQLMKSCAGALVTALALGLGSPATAGPAPDAAGPLSPAAAPRPGEAPRTVTLISGDQVTVSGDGGISVQPRPGVSFTQQKFQEHHYVIPSDARPLLAAGRLDDALFDVTALLEAGYDKTDDLPVIVSGAQQAPAGLTLSRKLPVAHGLAAKAPKKNITASWKTLKAQGLARTASYQKIWLDGLRQPTLDVSVPQVGAPVAWAAGLDGSGVKVAVLDTGIDAAHPDLAGKVVEEKNFTPEDGLDQVGHGTHVASTIAGTGAASGGKFKGVAPGASLLDGKVCAVNGCADSWILAGMQWAADNDAKVVNLSLSGSDRPGIDPLEQAVNNLTASRGMLFVIAAGNNGIFGEQTVESPGSADEALTVGAVDRNDALASFSGRGPRVGDLALKPDITAPGVGIVAARSKDASLGTPGEAYMPLNGTSMATPHVAGAAAIMTQLHPQWTAQQRKAALMGTAQPNPAHTIFQEGAGRLDIAAAITPTVTASPASISLGRQLFPHDDDVPDARVITYKNSGTSELNLELSVDSPAPAGMFSLSSTAVTVPAGGQATVTLTSDTRQGGDTFGHLGGRVVATAGEVRLQTPFVVDRETTRYVLDMSFLDRAGQPAQDTFVTLLDRKTFKFYNAWGKDSARLRLPPGDYIFATTVYDEAQQHFTQFTQASFPVTADRVMTLDARQGRTYDITVPDAAAKSIVFSLTTSVRFAGGAQYLFGLATERPSQVTSVQLGPKQVPGLNAFATAHFARPGPDGTTFNSKAVYQASWRNDQSLFDGLVKHLSKRDLAKIEQDFRPVAGKSAKHFVYPSYPEASGGGLGMDFSLPFQRDLYLVGDPNWGQFIFECTTEIPEQNAVITAADRPEQKYRAGQYITDTWGQPVHGPAFPPDNSRDYLTRTQNVMNVDIPHFTDADGHAGGNWINPWPIASGTTTLYRNGQLFGNFKGRVGYFENLPEENARYKLEATMQLAAPFTLSTKVHTIWEFNSARPGQTTDLPATAIGYAPRLDQHNSARTRQTMIVPVTVSQQGAAQPLKYLTISSSPDDGTSWKRARVTTIAGKTFAIITNPATAGFLSLRAQATDKDGNTVDQTIIRAYKVR